jgi:hypothetical protein
METNVNKERVTQAGDIDLQEVVVVKSNGEEVNLIGGFIGELNLFEDIYRGGLYGNILIIDALNIIQALGITGDEYLRLKIQTPSNDTRFIINKTFKVYSITDRIMLGDTGKQSYIMHFTSPEVFIDALSPVYKTFKYKTISSLASEVFNTYLSVSRNGQDAASKFDIIGETANSMQFTSPGWRPMKILNWLASKALGAGYKNPGYLFFESNKRFYFANIEQLIDTAIQNKTIYSEYIYMANNASSGAEAYERYSTDINFQYRKALDLKVIETFNGLKNTQTGFLANRLYTFDVVRKTHNVTDYDHVDSWDNYAHLAQIGGAAKPLVATGPSSDGSGALRSPVGMNQIYMQHDQLYTGVKNNVGDYIEKVLPIRTSTLAELTNFKIELTVPGRTDIEVGYVILLRYPDASPRSETDKNANRDDELYSGFYLITAIRHKITYNKHVMVLELIKDSFTRKN